MLKQLQKLATLERTFNITMDTWSKAHLSPDGFPQTPTLDIAGITYGCSTLVCSSRATNTYTLILFNEDTGKWIEVPTTEAYAIAFMQQHTL